MATKVSTLVSWIQTRNTLAQDLSSALALLENEPFSDDPTSLFQQGEHQVDRVLGAMRAHAVSGLKQIDDAIAGSDMVDALARLAEQAHEEAEELTEAIKTIGKITTAVDLATRVVGGIAGLPFL